MPPASAEPLRPSRLLVPMALVLLSMTTSAFAQGLPGGTLYVCDSGADSIVSVEDLDGDGFIDPITESNVYYDDSSPGPDLSTPNHLLIYGEGLLLSDGGTLDALFYLEDLNGDGDANDAGEIQPFYDDTASGLDLSTPNGIAQAPDGSILVTDDGASVRAIFRFSDLNNDNDALDDGEVQTFYDLTALSPSDPIFDPESIAVDTNGIVYVGDSNIGIVYRVEDLNGDGDGLDDNEATVFYSVAGGVMVQDIDALQVASNGDLFIVDEDNGTVLRVADSNGDNDALDAGEMEVFLDGTLSTDPNDAILVGPATLLLADGALDGVVLAADENGNGVATDPMETTLVFDGSGILSTPSGLAFRPDLTKPLPPQVSSVMPSSGPEAGGTFVTILGTELSTAQQVTFGNEAALGLTIVTGGEIAVMTPPGTGLVDVTVTTPGGSASLIGAFEYLSTPGIVVAGVFPDTGNVTGGDTVTINGMGWDPALSLEVTFDGLNATITQVDAQSLTVVTPPGTAGLVDVSVSQGAISDTLTGGFRYQVEFLRGDSDRSGSLGLVDPIITLYYLFLSADPTCLDALDVDDNGEIVVDDALLLLGYLFQGGPPPAAPHPQEGFDPTPGFPGCAM